LSLLRGGRAFGSTTATIAPPFAALAGRPLIGARSSVRGLCNLDAFALRSMLGRQAGKCDSVERGEGNRGNDQIAVH
jgi:hypothetical protein